MVGHTRIAAPVGDDRPNRYEENGHVIYRASALGMCMKSLVALGLGNNPEPHPDWLLQKFAEGVAGELVVIGMLRENWRIVDESEGHNYTWHDGQILVEVPVGTQVTIRGHADALGTCYKAVVPEYGESDWQVGEKRLIEVKCVSEDYAPVVLKNLPYYYLVQVVVYSHYVGFPPMLVLGVKDEEGQVKYLLSEMLDDLPIGIRDVKMRVMEIEEWIAKGELPPCDHPTWPCQFSWMCDSPGGPATEDWELEETLQRSLDMVRERVRVQNGQSDG